MKRVIVLFTVVLLAACARRNDDLATVAVTRGPIAQTVSASGTLAAQDTVLVGSQDSGTIQAIYVDYNSQVRKGQVLARLDPSLFIAQLDQAAATLGQLTAQRAAAAATASGSLSASSAARRTAEAQAAQIAAADEDVQKARSSLGLALLTLHRDRALLRQGYVAQNVVDGDVTNAAAAHDALIAAQTEAQTSRLTSSAGAYQAGSSAAQAVGAAASQRAGDAAMRAASAAVRQAQINLDHATITSPVDGTVIQRNVSVGQTVAAALQAPTLFTIAKNLTKMELDIAVGEPDVGAVRAGQRVEFTVLAYPGRTLETTIAQVRQNPTVINNVTTYNSVAYPSNHDGALRPGMTANVRVTIATYPDALIVPLAALQWRPSAATARKYRVVTSPSGEGITVARSIWGQTGAGADISVSPGGEARCYVLQGRTLREARVDVLAIDGARVGVRAAGAVLASDVRVVVDDGTGVAATASP